MKVKIYAVLDTKISAFMQPFFALTNGQAMRMFGDTVEDTNSNFHKHPEDYALYYLGEFDDASGKLTDAPTAEYLARANDFGARKAAEDLHNLRPAPRT